jgi:hypothetical protein
MKAKGPVGWDIVAAHGLGVLGHHGLRAGPKEQVEIKDTADSPVNQQQNYTTASRALELTPWVSAFRDCDQTSKYL